MTTKATNGVLNLTSPPIDDMVLLQGTLGTVTITSATITNATINGGATLSSLSSNFFSTYSQQASAVINVSLSGSLTDTGSFRDALYVQVTDTDVTSYSHDHYNVAGRFAVFAPFAGSANTKEQIAVYAYSYSNNTSTVISETGFPTGCYGIKAEAFQYGAGNGANTLVTHQPSGAFAQANNLSGAQIAVDNSHVDVDSTHTAYAVLASNLGTRKITAFYATTATNNATALYWLYAGSVADFAVVTNAAIVMPQGSTDIAGGLIDYGLNNGNPAGGSYTYWDRIYKGNPATGAPVGGRYNWVAAGNIILQAAEDAVVSSAQTGFAAINPTLTRKGECFNATGQWTDGLNLFAADFSDAGIVMGSIGTNGSVIKWSGTNYLQVTADNGGQFVWSAGSGNKVFYYDDTQFVVNVPIRALGGIS